jgi:hypothetical protein
VPAGLAPAVGRVEEDFLAFFGILPSQCLKPLRFQGGIPLDGGGALRAWAALAGNTTTLPTGRRPTGPVPKGRSERVRKRGPTLAVWAAVFAGMLAAPITGLRHSRRSGAK